MINNPSKEGFSKNAKNAIDKSTKIITKKRKYVYINKITTVVTI
jgi:hypothetical protein